MLRPCSAAGQGPLSCPSLFPSLLLLPSQDTSSPQDGQRPSSHAALNECYQRKHLRTTTQTEPFRTCCPSATSGTLACVQVSSWKKGPIQDCGRWLLTHGRKKGRTQEETAERPQDSEPGPADAHSSSGLALWPLGRWHGPQPQSDHLHSGFLRTGLPRGAL